MLSNKRQKTIKSYFHQTSFSKSKNGLYPSMPTSDLKLLQDAREAAPALFAKPGDKFEWTGCIHGESYVVEYVGRNTVPSKAVEFRGETTGEYMSPKKGWLIFKNSGGDTPLNVTSGGIRDACGSWPLACHYLYNEEGEVVDEGTMVLPPEKVGVLNKYRYYEGEEGEEEEGKSKSEKGPEEEIDVSNKLLQEAKKAVPALFAKPGDTFEWISCHPSWVEPCEMKYLGRNALRPTSERSPQIGWLVFKHLPEGFNNIDSIRSEISAYPYLTYSHYCYKDLKEATTLFELALWKAKIDEVDDPIDREACRMEVPGPVKDTLFSYLEGERKVGTLCIPPEKCGPIKGFVPGDDYW